MRMRFWILAGLLPLLGACVPDDVDLFPDLEQSYQDIVAGWEIRYPTDWSVDPDSLLVTPAWELPSTAFVYPADKDQSALLGARMQVARSSDSCDTLTRDLDGDWSEGAAGSIYAGTLYTERAANNGCFAVALTFRLCSLGPACGPDHQQPFDDDQLQRIFRRMTESFQRQ